MRFHADIDECAQTPWLCGPNAQCTNTVGSYTCSCNPGLFPNTGLQWILNQTQCEDLTKIQDGKTCNIPINTGTLSHLNSSSAWFCLITNFSSTKFTSGYQVQQVAGVLSSALSDTSLWSNLTRDEKSVAAEAYLDTVERVLLQFTEPSDALLKKNVRSDNLDMELLIIPFKHNTSEEQLQANKNTLEIKLGKLMEENKQGQITVGFVSYTGMDSVLDGSFYKNQSSIQLNSQVVTATIGRNHHKLSEPVHLTFHHNESRARQGSHSLTSSVVVYGVPLSLSLPPSTTSPTLPVVQFPSQRKKQHITLQPVYFCFGFDFYFCFVPSLPRLVSSTIQPPAVPH
ncbi:adhesion G protein-coupled receptor E2-like [Acipenser oxyrinchus oxyrinchus]|uniref:Adhesion G protein-coupled receptor E2-like n=1 Tax=Acipenser oxyrinchus oxyrinchus TaxID=40147 RepID=A0AAD8CMP0_ACIOX|nr:adhesion G protein-coupled receptor E2-like [Acipenser oxyrinchus oxyrinchus]